MLITSKFQPKVAAPIVVILAVVAIVIIVTYVINENREAPLIVMMAFYVPALFLAGLIIFGELRKRAIQVMIDNETITVKRYLGWGKEELHFLNSFDGYYVTDLRSRYGSYEYLYLVKDGKKVIKLSGFYHKNYLELKAALARRVKYNGYLPYNFFREMKEFFQ